METTTESGNRQRQRSWELQSREERILDIQELIDSPCWSVLNAGQQSRWLAQLRDLQIE